MNKLISVIRRVDPGEVPWSRLEGVVRAAAAVLDQGGERAPVPRVDPRMPPDEGRPLEVESAVAPASSQ